MGYGRQYFRHSAISVVTTIAIGILFYALRVVLYGKLSPEDYGLFYSIMSACMMLHPFLSLGFDPGIAPFITRFRESRRHDQALATALGSLAVQLALVALVGLPVLIAAPWISRTVFGREDAVPLIRILVGFVFLLQPFKTVLTVLLGVQFIGTRNLADLSRVVGNVAAAVLLLYWGLGVKAAAWSYVLAAFVGTSVGLVGLVRLYPELFRARFRWDCALLAEVFHSGKYLAIAFGGIAIFAYMDTVMLALVEGDLRAIAAYQLAIPAMMLLNSLILAGVNNFMPMVTTLWVRNEKGLLADGIQRMYEGAVALLVPGGVLAACFSDVLMRTLFGKDVLNAPDAFNLLAAGSILFFVSSLNLHALAGMGRTRAAAITVGGGLVANLALNVVLIHYFSIRGAAMATVISYAVTAASGWAVLRREIPLRLRWRTIPIALLVTTGMAWLAMEVRATALFTAHPPATSIVAGIALYGGAVGLLEGLQVGRLAELVSVVVRGFPTRKPK